MRISRDAVVKALDDVGLLVEQRGALPESFNAISDDSRAITPGALFIAVKGTDNDGHAWIGAAALAGAAAAIVEDAGKTQLPVLVVRNGRRAAAIAAAAAYGWPARSLELV